MKKRFHKLERTSDHIPEMLRGIDFPHTRGCRGRSLRKSYEKAENYLWHLVFYTTRLRQLGIRELDIWLMMTDPYWDAFEEFHADSTFASYKQEARKLAGRCISDLREQPQQEYQTRGKLGFSKRYGNLAVATEN